jgi:hypothetical protein
VIAEVNHLSSRGTPGGPCSEVPGGPLVVSALASAPVDATLVAGAQMFVPPIHAEYVP